MPPPPLPPFGSGSVSLRVYPHELPAALLVEEMRAQAALADRAGFDGVMTAEHHGGFPGYISNPVQMAGWLLEAMETGWAAPAPLLLPLKHWTHVAEELAWLSCRFPGRVGAGFASGGLALDFELAELPYKENMSRFKAALPLVVDALSGRAMEPLANDSALAACVEHPVPTVCAAQSPGGVRRAARLGMGVLYDSLQTVERTRELSDAYREAGGTGPLIAIRRVWVGPPPVESVETQMKFYQSYAKQSTQTHWGKGQELISGENGEEVAERLAAFAHESGCDAFNLRVHLSGLGPARVREQIDLLGAETLPRLHEELAALANGSTA
jgi:alkanesulfonate monooxygenase SsuD/methylene tetrahydromethanopterin reductase-like flavin-dependent oxidoreductase (luciferase family)